MSHSSMATTLKNHISKESFLFACEICENDDPSITYRVATHFADEMNNLVLNNAFITDSLNYCLNKDGDIEDLYFKNSEPGYIDKNNNFIPISLKSLTKFNLKLDWVVKNICTNCEISFDKYSEEIVPNLLWHVGFINIDMKIPVFFARKITKEEAFDKIQKTLSSRKSSLEGIILTSCSNIPSYFNSKIAGNKIISIRNCLSADKKDFNIDKSILKSALLKAGKDGFSTGYRSACFNNEYFRFTKQEADVLEFLYKAGKPVHKDEIMVEVTESSTELKTLFRSSDSKNIRKNILQHDKKGYYWLNLN